MSYVRWGTDSDVYVYPSIAYPEPHNIVCCSCSLGGGEFVGDARGMLEHLAEHTKRGHQVPERATARLSYEAGEVVNAVVEDKE